MARPPGSSPATRARATAHTFVKPSSQPVHQSRPINIDQPVTPSTNHASLHPPQPHVYGSSSTSPYSSSGEDHYHQRGAYPHPDWRHAASSGLMPPPAFSPRHPASMIPLTSSPADHSSSPMSNLISPRHLTPQQAHHFAAYTNGYPPIPYMSDPYTIAPYGSSPGYDFAPGSDAASDPVATMSMYGMETDNEMGLDYYFDYDSMTHSGVCSEVETSAVDSQLLSTTTNGVSSPSSKKKPERTPRPPNAWILYRSDKLKAIGKGEAVPGLDEAMADFNLASGGSAESEGDKNGKTKTKKKGKKDKDPPEGLLSLGSGKNGRGLPQADISRLISTLWKRESKGVREEYERRSEEKKREHAKQYPGYKFQPQRKADKIRLREEKEREKEIARREKELQRSAGRPRRTRTRSRMSPTTPYSVMSGEGHRAMARSLSYGETPPNVVYGPFADSAQSSFPSTPEQGGNEQENKLFRSYPFPMPDGALPSMKGHDVGLPYGSQSFIDLDNASATPGLESLSKGVMHPDTLPLAPPPHLQPSTSSSRSRSCAPPTGAEGPQQNPVSAFVLTPQAPVSREPSEAPEAANHARSAPPAEVQMPAQTGTASVGQGQQESSEQKATKLAMLWCEMVEEPEATAEDTLESGPPSTAPQTGAAPTELVPQEGAAAQATRSIYPAPGTWENIELTSLCPAVMPGSTELPEPNPEYYTAQPFPTSATPYYWPGGYTYLTEGQAQQYTILPVPQEVTEPIPLDRRFYEHQMRAMEDISRYNSQTGQTLVAIPTAQGAMIPMQAIMIEEQGPFLSEQRPLFSPADAEWTLRPTSYNEVGDRRASNTSYEGTLMPYTVVPRHVSSSAYPLTPHSADNGWTDRNTSFAFASFMQGGQDLQMDASTMLWDEQEAGAASAGNDPRSRVVTPKSVESRSPAAQVDQPTPTGSPRLPTPVSMVNRRSSRTHPAAKK